MFLHFRSPVGFALLLAGMFLLAFNQRFWATAAGMLWHGRLADALPLAALALFLLLSYAAALLLIPGRRPMMIAAALLFPVAAMAAYCADSFGVVIDKDMVHNFGQTDRREVLGLLTPRLLVYILGLGVLPVFLVARCRIAKMGWRGDVRRRLLFLLPAFMACALMLASIPVLRTALMEHGRLRSLSVPGAAVAATGAYLHAGLTEKETGRVSLRTHAPWRTEAAAGDKPLLVFLVVGETARHANFQLGGYPRPTNPELSRVANLFYFTRAESCATFTAVSVPCMLSHVGRSGFSLSAYREAPNALEDFLNVGIGVQWRSNNTARFDPGNGISKIAFSAESHPGLCSEESCFDEVLLHGLEQEMENGGGDKLIAFHQMGSHGPAYFLRYPPSFETFKPACQRKDIASCSTEELRNAYDNSIRYTDSVLARMISMLQKRSDRSDTALIYVSDHGESLGEGGVYLHSAPYADAPQEQKRIPLMLWASRGYMERFGINATCLRQRLDTPGGHDNVYHTLLGLMAVGNEFYAKELDLLAACRSGKG